MQNNNFKKIELTTSCSNLFKTKTTYEVHINEEKFVADENIEIEKKNQESKFNIRVKKCDLYLLDEMAKHVGVSRSMLLNYIVYEILKKEVNSIEDKDTVALIAYKADMNSKIDNLSTPWTYTFFKPYLDAIIENAINWNTLALEYGPYKEEIPMQTSSSESFIEVLKKIR